MIHTFFYYYHSEAFSNFVPLCRTLTDRQRALLMSYAEDETDVEGTVNGVTTTATGNGTDLTPELRKKMELREKERCCSLSQA